MAPDRDDIVQKPTRFVVECSYCGERRVGDWEGAPMARDAGGGCRTSHGCCPACEPRLLLQWMSASKMIEDKESGEIVDEPRS